MIFQSGTKRTDIGTIRTETNGTNQTVMLAQFEPKWVALTHRNQWHKSNRCNQLEMPFVLKDEKTKTFRGISMKFFTDSFYQLDHFYGGDTRVIQKAGEYFNKGIRSYQSKDYESSIKNFTKSYELDPKNIDALYNRAAIYYETGKLELACKDWNELSELGQKRGMELLKNNCKKTTYNIGYNSLRPLVKTRNFSYL